MARSVFGVIAGWIANPNQESARRNRLEAEELLSIARSRAEKAEARAASAEGRLAAGAGPKPGSETWT